MLLLSYMQPGFHVRYQSQILLKLEFCRQIFEGYSTIKLHENPISESRVCCTRTDGQAGGIDTEGLT